jgi:type IV pilus assembly protein PilN
VLGVIVLEVVGLFLLHRKKLEELQEQRNVNTQLEAKIDGIRKLLANHDEVKKALAVFRAREDAIARLQAARSGPTAVLLELAQILTPHRGPTTDTERLEQIRKDNPLMVYNANWDSHRLWLTSYVESDRTLKIEVLARDGSDVSELAQRLKLSAYFYDVTLLPGGKGSPEKDSKVELVNFALQLKVRY